MIQKLLSLFCCPAEKSNLRLFSKSFVFACTFICIGGIMSTNAQVTNYAVTQNLSTFPAFPASNVTQLLPTNANTDNFVSPADVNIGFPFSFNGVSYSTLRISLNGFITFGSTVPSATDIYPLSNNGGYSGAVAIYGWDLDVLAATAALNVRYTNITATGTAPNRIFKIVWNVRRSNNAGTVFNADGTSTNLGMQMWLYETSNKIEMYYNAIAPSTISTYGQIGLRGASNTDYNNLQYADAAPWPGLPTVMAAGTTNTASVLLNNTTLINTASNKLFTWTPSGCFRPNGVKVSNVSINTADVNWTAVSPAPSGYEYILSNSATPPLASATGTAIATTTLPLSALTGGSTYYIYVRSVCGGTKSDWSSATFNTLCSPASINYTQGFERTAPGYAYAIPNIPPCSTIQNTGFGNNWVTEAAFPSEGFNSDHLVYNSDGSQAASVWYFTQGITLLPNTSYRLSYKYGGSSNISSLNNQMLVTYGTAPTQTAMSALPANLLVDHKVIKDSPLTNVVNFKTPAAGGPLTYYIGFYAKSAFNMGKLYLDDIELSPTSCFAPTSLVAGQITQSSALIAWTAPTTTPASGYQYYYSTSATPPTASTTISGSSPGVLQTLNGLAAGTTYRVWVRSACGNGDFSEWSSVLVFTTAAASPVITYCTPQGIQGSFSQDPNGITNVTMGSINNSTGIETNNYGNYSNLVTTVARGAVVPVSITYATGFSYNTKIFVDWNNNGNFDDAGEDVYTGESATAATSTLLASFTVPAMAPLGVHRLRIGGADFGGVTACRNGTYQAYEDYSIYVITAPAALALSSASTTICGGTDSSAVTVATGGGPGGYNVYSWSPASGVTGDATSGFVFNTGTATTYVLTAFNSVTLESNTTSFRVEVNRPPLAIAITPSAAAYCQNQNGVVLTAAGGVSTGESILLQNFNEATLTGWTVANFSTGGTIANAEWKPRPSGHNPGGYWNDYGVFSIRSNDNSQFYFSNSDAQSAIEQGAVTKVTMTSPVFSLAGYSAASLSFWHYLVPIVGDNANVEISTDAAGTVWTTLETYGTFQGTNTNFKNTIIDLNSYLGQATVRIRFRYAAEWGYGWAVDNVLVSGNAISSITWAPVTGLWQDAARTIPYAGGGAAVVYAAPSSATTYTASASSGLGCATNTSHLVNVTPIAGGTVGTSSQNICGGTVASSITLTGQVGTIAGWEYADDASFTTGLTSIPGTAGLTALSPAIIGSVSANRFYRAVVTAADCAIAYSTIHAINIPSTTYNGVWSNGLPDATKQVVFNGNYTMAANMAACSVRVLSGTVTVNSNVTLTVENGINVAGGSLIFENSSSLLQTTTSKTANTGNILYRRVTPQMVAFDYTFWSSPMEFNTLQTISPNTRFDKYFWWNPTAYNWETITNPAITNMTPGRGYLIRAPYDFTATPQNYTGPFSGVPNNGLVEIPIVVNGANNINFVGNPYPSAINAEIFMSENAATLGTGTTLYFWTHNHPISNGQYSDTMDYASLNITGGTATGFDSTGSGTGNNLAPTKYIAAGQGFMAVCSNSGTMVFNNTMRLGGNNGNFFKTGEFAENSQKNRYWLDLKNEQGAFKQMLVGYIENASNTYDAGYDGEIMEVGNSVSFYSLLDGKKLSIQGRSLAFDVNEEIPVGIRVTAAGTYTISLSDKDGFFDTQEIYLEDRLTGTVYNLRQGAYSFDTVAGVFDARFVIKYVNNVLATQTSEFNESAVVVYKDQNGINLRTSGYTMDSVKIFDVNGRELLFRQGINSSNAVISNLRAAQQVLLLRIVSNDGIVVNKKIVF